MVRLLGSGLKSVKLLMQPIELPHLVNKNRDPPAGTLSLRYRMYYLRRVYFLLFLQFALISIACFILHMTPGVRPFVQEHVFPVPLTIFLFMLSGFLLKKFRFKRFYNITSLLLFTVALLAFIMVFSAQYDSESGFEVTALMSIVFLMHSFYCVQALRDLNVVSAIIVSAFICVLTSMFIQVFLSLIYYDYFFNITFALILTAYAHVNIRFHLFRFSVTEFDLGCISVFTTLFPYFPK